MIKKTCLLMVLFYATAGYGQTVSDYLNSAKSKSKNKDYAGAKADYDKAIEMDPENSLLLYNLKKSLKENTAKYISAKDLFDGFYKAIINNSENLPQYAAIKNVGDEGGEFIFIKK